MSRHLLVYYLLKIATHEVGKPKVLSVGARPVAQIPFCLLS